MLKNMMAIFIEQNKNRNTNKLAGVKQETYWIPGLGKMEVGIYTL